LTWQGKVSRGGTANLYESPTDKEYQTGGGESSRSPHRIRGLVGKNRPPHHSGRNSAAEYNLGINYASGAVRPGSHHRIKDGRNCNMGSKTRDRSRAVNNGLRAPTVRRFCQCLTRKTFVNAVDSKKGGARMRATKEGFTENINCL